MHSFNDSAGTQEQKRLEKGVSHQVEHGSSHRADTESHHHVAQLADGRISKYALHRSLSNSDRCGKYSRESTKPGNKFQNNRNLIEKEKRSGNQVHTGNDHGRGVNKCGYRCRTFHGIRQPHMKRELTGLADRPDKQQEGY